MCEAHAASVLVSQIRNWDHVEKEAEGKVRSPDFKKQFDQQVRSSFCVVVVVVVAVVERWLQGLQC